MFMITKIISLLQSLNDIVYLSMIYRYLAISVLWSLEIRPLPAKKSSISKDTHQQDQVPINKRPFQ